VVATYVVRAICPRTIPESVRKACPESVRDVRFYETMPWKTQDVWETRGHAAMQVPTQPLFSGINTTLIFSSSRIVKLPGRFRSLARSVLRIFRLTEDLPAIRQYLALNLGGFPQSIESGFR
jgi:hypothetical protein